MIISIKGYKYLTLEAKENARTQLNTAYNIGLNPNNTTTDMVNWYEDTIQGFYYTFENQYTIPIFGQGTTFDVNIDDIP